MHVTPTLNSTPDELASQVRVAHPEVGSTTDTLIPVLAQSVEAVRDKLLTSGISEKDVADASAWARRLKE